MSVDFTATPLAGFSPQDVVFADASDPSSSSWLWDFGDGRTSAICSPTHTYSVPGSFDVALTSFHYDYARKQKIADVPALGLIGVGPTPFSTTSFYRVHVGQWDYTYGSSTVFVYTVTTDGSVAHTSTYEAATSNPGCRGKSDIDGYMASAPPVSDYQTHPRYYWHEGAAGTRLLFEWPAYADTSHWGGHETMHFCMRGRKTAFTSTITALGEVFLFDRADDSSTTFRATSLIPDEGIHGCSIDIYGDDVYVLGTNAHIYVFHASGLGFRRVILSPPGVTSRNIVVDQTTGDVYLLCSSDGTHAGAVFAWNGLVWQQRYPDGTWVDAADDIESFVGMASKSIFAMDAIPAAWRITEYLNSQTTVKQHYINIDPGDGVLLPELMMPSSIPSFLSAGHSVQLVDIYGNIGWSTGEDSKRPVYTTAPRIVTVSLDLSANQMADFYNWFEGPANGGTSYFSCQLANFGPGLLWFKSRFYTPYVATPDANGTRWEVKFNLYVLGEGTFTMPARTSFLSSRGMQLQGSADIVSIDLFSSSRSLELTTFGYAFSSNRSLPLETRRYT